MNDGDYNEIEHTIVLIFGQNKNPEKRDGEIEKSVRLVIVARKVKVFHNVGNRHISISKTSLHIFFGVWLTVCSVLLSVYACMCVLFVCMLIFVDIHGFSAISLCNMPSDVDDCLS